MKNMNILIEMQKNFIAFIAYSLGPGYSMNGFVFPGLQGIRLHIQSSPGKKKTLAKSRRDELSRIPAFFPDFHSFFLPNLRAQSSVVGNSFSFVAKNADFQWRPEAV